MLRVLLVLCCALVAAVSLNACSNKEDDLYLKAKPLPPLEVPPDLVSPRSDPDLAVPRVAAAGVPGAPPAASVQRDGSRRWLVAVGASAEILSRLKAFLEQSGWTVERFDRVEGIVTTAWRPASDPALRTIRRHRLRWRVEAGRVADTSEIYLVHESLQREAGASEEAWRAGESDPLLEAQWLDRFKTYLSGSPAFPGR